MFRKKIVPIFLVIMFTVCLCSMTALAATKLSTPSITLSGDASSGKNVIKWKKIKNAKEYQVYYATSKNGSYKRLVTTTSTTHTHKSATAGKVYYYKVRAKSGSRYSSYSSKKYRTCDCARPEITLKLTDAGKPHITWEKVEGAKEYQVYRSTGATKTYSRIGTSKTTWFKNTSAKYDTKYYYKVRAVGPTSASTSAYSSYKSITPKKVETSTDTSNAYVNVSFLYIYKDKTDSSEKIATPIYMEGVQLGEKVTNSSSGSWRKVQYKGKNGYVWCPVKEERFTTKKRTFNYEGQTTVQQEVLDLAMKVHSWNTVYKHGGSDDIIDEGNVYEFDCSGFVSYVLNTALRKHVPVYKASSGIKTLAVTTALYNQGYDEEFTVTTVAKEDMQPGDIILFDERGEGINHCAIYMGNNEFMHSSQTGQGVNIMPLDSRYTGRVVEIKRYIPSKFEPLNRKMKINQYARLFEQMTSASDWVRLRPDDKVTVLYTYKNDTYNNGGWAYVIRNTDGAKGYVGIKSLSSID